MPVVLNPVALLANLRRARNGAAPGPSGLTAEILRVVLDDAEASQTFSDVASQLACAGVPDDIVPALGLGRVVALRKPNGGTGGLMIGDFLCRLVARTLAQQFAGPVAEACHLHPYALGSRVGAEALIHEVQAGCAADPGEYDSFNKFECCTSPSTLLRSFSGPIPFAALLANFSSIYLNHFIEGKTSCGNYMYAPRRHPPTQRP